VKQRRIYLIGFMGAGKSTIGRLLAKRLGWAFIDLDREIEKSERRSISDIFLQDGEPHFRKLEHQHLCDLATRQHLVVALGGGAFLDKANRDLTTSTGVTVWLKVSFATVVSRVRMDGTRPKFATREQAENLYQIREPIYSLASIHTDADNRPPSEVADELLGVIRKL
jgi:shikimate kinase